MVHNPLVPYANACGCCAARMLRQRNRQKGKPSGIRAEMSVSGKKKAGGGGKDFKEYRSEGIIRAGKWGSSV